jgi:hypothetical protein
MNGRAILTPILSLGSRAMCLDRSVAFLDDGSVDFDIFAYICPYISSKSTCSPLHRDFIKNDSLRFHTCFRMDVAAYIS